jgi:hypothetical protein
MDAPPAQGDPVDAKTLIPAPFTNLPAPRPKGAYLHWALPDALCHGEQTQVKQGDTLVSDTKFPVIPDRWLVLRLHPSASAAGRRSIRGWVLKAHDPNPQPIDLDTFKETGAPAAAIKKPLTVLGHGDVGWSAYFDNVVNRMAFYDSLQGVTTDQRDMGYPQVSFGGQFSTIGDPASFVSRNDRIPLGDSEDLHQVQKAVDRLVSSESRP